MRTPRGSFVSAEPLSFWLSPAGTLRNGLQLVRRAAARFAGVPPFASWPAAQLPTERSEPRRHEGLGDGNELGRVEGISAGAAPAAA